MIRQNWPSDLPRDVQALLVQTMDAAVVSRAAVIGLGSMGMGIAHSLRRAGFDVVGCDVNRAAVERFVQEGGRGAPAPASAAANVDVVICVVVNAAQTEAVLFGENGAASRRIATRLEASGRLYLDAPISGGAARAADGSLTVLASGAPAAFAKARPALEAMAATVHQLGSDVGVGSAFKMINQLLAGVHIAAAGEAIAFAAKQGLDLRKVYEVITGSAGNSWMFENRIPHVLDGDYAPRSAVDIFVKDLGIVQDMARDFRYPVPLAAAAMQVFLMASGAGMGRDDDASVARIYARLTGTALPQGFPADQR
jgi:L-threonate 2-dehydrogenase